MATVIVVAAVAAMIALGVWQLQRRQEKLALLALYAGNEHRPAIAMPAAPDDAVLFRRAAATCLRPSGWRRDAGRDARGGSGWRTIAQCRQPAGAAFAVQMGIGNDPLHTPAWSGGQVSGYITHAPQHRALIEGLFSAAPNELMLVADTPLPGLRANPAANLDDVPNNHLAYAVQWFVFASIAAIIYALARQAAGAGCAGRRHCPANPRAHALRQHPRHRPHRRLPRGDAGGARQRWRPLRPRGVAGASRPDARSPRIAGLSPMSRPRWR